MTIKFNNKALLENFAYRVSNFPDTFLAPRKPKPVQVNNWREVSGSEYDLSMPRFEDRKFLISGFIVAQSTADFWTKYNALVAELEKPGILKVHVGDLDKDFDTTYLEITNFKQSTSIKSSTIVVSFDIHLQEVSYVLDTYYDDSDLPPTAYAGVDKTVTLPTASTTLSGSANGANVTVLWIKISGGAANIVNQNSVTTIVNGLEVGIYEFELTVTDDQGRVVTDRVIITVALPAAPTVNAGIDRVISLPTNSLSLTATQTGTGVTVVWTKVNGGAATIVSPTNLTTTINGFVAGDYVFMITATDSFGRTTTDQINITVQAEGVNLPPVVNAGSNQTITLPAGLTLTGTATDNDGTIVSTVWAKVSGGAATITNPNNLSTTVTGVVPGAYVFSLTATDNKGAQTTTQVTITVNAAANQAPAVNAGSNQTITLPAGLTLTGTATDNDGTIVSTVWAKVSGGAATITNPNSLNTTVTGVVAGAYVFSLTATDNNGAQTTAQVTITINAAPSGEVVGRWSLGAVGSETHPDWTNLFGDPLNGVVSAVSGGITLANTGNWANVGGSSAYKNTNTRGGILYLDHNGEQQTLPQAVTRSNWVNGSNTAYLKATGLPPGNYQVRIFAFTDGGGSWTTSTATNSYIIVGSTTVNRDDHKYYQLTDDRANGAILSVSPDVNGELLIHIKWGNGAWFGACVNAIEIRKIS